MSRRTEKHTNRRKRTPQTSMRHHIHTQTIRCIAYRVYVTPRVHVVCRRNAAIEHGVLQLGKRGGNDISAPSSRRRRRLKNELKSNNYITIIVWVSLANTRMRRYFGYREYAMRTRRSRSTYLVNTCSNSPKRLSDTVSVGCTDTRSITARYPISESIISRLVHRDISTCPPVF